MEEPSSDFPSPRHDSDSPANSAKSDSENILAVSENNSPAEIATIPLAVAEPEPIAEGIPVSG